MYERWHFPYVYHFLWTIVVGVVGMDEYRYESLREL